MLEGKCTQLIHTFSLCLWIFAHSICSEAMWIGSGWMYLQLPADILGTFAFSGWQKDRIDVPWVSSAQLSCSPRYWFIWPLLKSLLHLCHLMPWPLKWLPPVLLHPIISYHPGLKKMFAYIRIYHWSIKQYGVSSLMVMILEAVPSAALLRYVEAMLMFQLLPSVNNQ